MNNNNINIGERYMNKKLRKVVKFLFVVENKSKIVYNKKDLGV